MRLIALVLSGALLLAACAEDGSPRETPRSAASSPRPDGPRQRKLTKAELPLVHNRALGPSREVVARAVADVKRLGYWNDLAGHLFIVLIESRVGRQDVPEDKHLADAKLTAHMTPRGDGGLCSIVFYPTAMRDDLVRQGEYYEQGMLPEPPPSGRQFWASILGHELAHCAPGQPGEPYAQKWEKRVLDAARSELP